MRKDFRKIMLILFEKNSFFLPDSPINFVSALTGYSISDFLQVARDLDSRMNKTLATSALNKVIGDMWEHRPCKNKRQKI